MPDSSPIFLIIPDIFIEIQQESHLFLPILWEGFNLCQLPYKFVTHKLTKYRVL